MLPHYSFPPFNSSCSSEAVMSSVLLVGFFGFGKLGMSRKLGSLWVSTYCWWTRRYLRVLNPVISNLPSSTVLNLCFLRLHSTMMQGSIHVLHLPKFQPSLVEGAVYVISGFEVTRSNTRFKITDFDKSIRLNPGTSMDVIDESLCVIPKELFRFRSHEQLVTLSNTNKELPDVIGQVCSSKVYRNEATQKMERMLVHLRLESGENVRLSAFNEKATTLNRRMEKKEGGTCVLLATSINPKFFGGQLFLNATSGTHFYFDSEVEATRLFAESQGNKETGDKFRGVQKIEQVSIGELNEFVLGPNTEDAEFLCTAKVVDIQGDKGWNFISCSNCGKKMVREESSLSCPICHYSGVVGNVRYRVEMVVNDGVADAV